MSITEYNGGAVIAMVGKNCVAIGSDKRLGAQALTVSTEFPKVFKMEDNIYIGLAGLVTDILTVQEQLKMKCQVYKLEEEKTISPRAFAHLVSSTLYEKRFGPFFIEPVIAGIDTKDNTPFICSMDLIGCINFAKDFVVAGTASSNLYGICESLYEPDMDPETLFEVTAQCLMNAVDRDALSGWGGEITIITPDKVIVRTLKARQD